MECCNRYCLWCSFGQCCHESEEGHMNATPSELDCPSSLRADHESSLYKNADAIKEYVEKLNHRQLTNIRQQMEKMMIKNGYKKEKEKWIQVE